MAKKMKVYFPIWEEANLREAFAKFHESLGFPKIIKSIYKTGSPDYLLEDAKGNTVRAEAKLYSSGAKDLEGLIDLVICWDHDWKECPASIKVLDLSEHVDDPSTVFEGLASAIIDFLKNKDQSIEVEGQDYSYFAPRYFILSKKFDQQELIISVSYDYSDGLGYYGCSLSVPEWLLQKFDVKSWPKILEPLLNKGFSESRTIDRVGTSEKISAITISRKYEAKDLMDDPVKTKELFSDVFTIFNFIETCLKGK